MKKKLIAIVASLAMVATMVPATAFADVTPMKASLSEAAKAAHTGSGEAEAYAGMLDKGNEANVVIVTTAKGLKLSGALPYQSYESFSGVEAMQTGHYIGFTLKTTGGTVANQFIRTNKVHMSGTSVISTTEDIVGTDLNTGITERVRLDDGKTIYVDEGESPVASKWYTSEMSLVDASDANKSKYEDIKKMPELSPNAATLTFDTTDLNMLNKEDTAAMNNWVKKVQAIDPTALNTTAGIRTVKLARETYDALDSSLKAVVNSVIQKDSEFNYKNLYEQMIDAEEAIEGNSALDGIYDKIVRLKDLPTTAFKDQAEIETYFTPLDEINKLVEGLNSTLKKQFEASQESKKLKEQNDEFAKLIKKYVDPLYAAAAKIDLSQGVLEGEDLATVRELITYVEGGYIKTATIANFNQTTYDALIAALDKIAKDEISLENATIAAIADQAYTGAAIEPAVTVTDKAGKEVPADDYTVIYSNNKDAGTATVTVAAKSSSAYTGSVSATFTIAPAALTDAMVKSVANATYTGKAVTPAVTVEKGVTYDVAYSNNTAVGKATATITGTENYTGTITKNFIVKPATEAISSLKAGKKSLTVAYKAQTGAKYRIVYSPAKGQAKAVNTTATKKTIKSLKAGKTYKVKVRAYKVIDGTPYNGSYSTVKKVKVK